MASQTGPDGTREPVLGLCAPGGVNRALLGLALGADVFHDTGVSS